MRVRFHHDPEAAMLDQFNASEHERLLPMWRRARGRLLLVSGAGLAISLWVLVTYLEMR